MNKKKIIFIVLIGLLALVLLPEAGQSGQLNKESLIRFHVLANSDSPADQALKLKVRDQIMKEMSDSLKNVKSIEESRVIISKELDHIQAVAAQVVAENQENYAVTVALEKQTFPTRKYGNLIFPAGDYEALRVIIGEGQGQNWWCVMFPPLCFIDVKSGLVDEKTKQELKAVLSEDEYQLVLSGINERELPLQLRSKLWDLIVKSKNQISRLAAFF
ncbi:stage II sporulation protein R [Alkaliphilus crotonatoxidans]